MGEHESQRTGKGKKKQRKREEAPFPLPECRLCAFAPPPPECRLHTYIHAPLSLLSLSYLVPRPHYSARPWVTLSERTGRLGYVTEMHWPIKPGKTPHKDKANPYHRLNMQTLLHSMTLFFLTGIRKMEDTSEKRSVSDVPKNYLNLPQNWNANINTSLMVRPVVYYGVKRCYALHHLRSNLSCCKTSLSWAG